MKKILLPFLISALIPGHLLADQADQYTQEARGLVKEFVGGLKGELKAAMEKGGPVNAIGTCNKKAPEIAEQKSQQFQWKMARTSLKLRNQDNAPDGWEQNVLESFEKRKAAGEDVRKMEHREIVEKDGKQVFRYMKAIPAGKACLKCHGDGIDAEVVEKLDELYPEDKARDFKEGDIRGAFTFEKAL
jgi:hypothetical protein